MESMRAWIGKGQWQEFGTQENFEFQIGRNVMELQENEIESPMQSIPVGEGVVYGWSVPISYHFVLWRNGEAIPLQNIT